MIRFALAIALLPISAGAFTQDMPDASLTPGATNPDVTQANIGETICVPDWTKSIRPSASYTGELKRKQMEDRGLPGEPSAYEEDHLISLEIGGSPTDEQNLWPEPWTGTWNAHVKDKLENRLHKLVCAGTITLDEAQKAIAADWKTAYCKYVGGEPCE